MVFPVLGGLDHDGRSRQPGRIIPADIFVAVTVLHQYVLDISLQSHVHVVGKAFASADLPGHPKMFFKI